MFLSHTPPLLEEESVGSEDDDESHESQLITNEPYVSVRGGAGKGGACGN